MRGLQALLLTALGWLLAVAVVEASAGRLRPGLPSWAAPAVVPVAFLLFGAYLALALGPEVPRWVYALQAAVALAAAGVPLLSVYGLAARYGLPPHGGAVAAFLARPLAQGLAALWFALALGALGHRPIRPVPPPVLPRPPEPTPPALWSPSPVSEGFTAPADGSRAYPPAGPGPDGP
jgi:ABC-type transport system involved in cytochrome c biogenesis permease subunit